MSENHEIIRTRFAPSPTGYMHIGNLRTALYSYLLSKNMKGKLILRIEDTDEMRLIKNAIDNIFDVLKDVGINFDEGPHFGGEYGPYIQSQRKEIYKKYSNLLLEIDGCYPCFCTKERLEMVHENQRKEKTPPMYDGKCRNLNKEVALEKMKEMSYVLRQKNPKTGTTTFKDEVYGEITVDNITLDDHVLIKQDGTPTYNFANVLDDHLMKITHVIRGNEYLSSTPKYTILYKMFGFKEPIYIHTPPIIKENGKKLSKRDGDATYEDLKTKGYEKEAIINYIVLLGWSSKTEKEIFTLEELINAFDIKGIGKSPAVFDEKKLNFINSVHIKNLTSDEFHKKAIKYYNFKSKNIDNKILSEVLHTRIEKFSEINENIDFIDEAKKYDIDLFINTKMKTNLENSLTSLKTLKNMFENIELWNKSNIHDKIIKYAAENGVKNGVLLWPLRICLSGKTFTAGGGIELSIILGRDETLKRINNGIDKLENETIDK